MMSFEAESLSRFDIEDFSPARVGQFHRCQIAAVRTDGSWTTRCEFANQPNLSRLPAVATPP